MGVLRKKAVQFVEIDPRAWTPLPESERLDAYYHLREVQGAAALLLKAQEEALLLKKRGTMDVIRAEVLGQLPATADMSIEERLKLMHPEIIEEKKEALPLKKEMTEVEEELAALRREKKRSKRPQTALTTNKKDANRPTSAPARFIRKAPIRVYGDEGERGPPDPPLMSCTPKKSYKRGYNNTIFSDRLMYDEDQKKKEQKITTRSKPAWASKKIVPVEEEPLRGLTPRRAETLRQCPENQRVRRVRLIEFTGTIIIQLTSPTPWATVRYAFDGEVVHSRSTIFFRVPLKSVSRQF